MIKEIEKLLNDYTVSTAAVYFNATKDHLRLIGNFESHVFEFKIEEHYYILKITHTIRRSLNYLLGEIEFLNYLFEKKVNVHKPVKSVNGKYVEEIKAESGSFLAYAFEKAPGDLIPKDKFDGEKLFKWGELLANINKYSKDFEPSDIIYKRNHWFESMKSYFDRFVPTEEQNIINKTYSLMEKIRQIPESKDNFGLTHSDLSHLNLVYHSGKLTAIDFDECSYQYFAYDIAWALFCSIRYLKCLGMQNDEFIIYFNEHFIKGYRTILDIPDTCLKNIPDFLRLNNCIQYAADRQYFGIENVSERGKEILDFRKEMILKDEWAEIELR